MKECSLSLERKQIVVRIPPTAKPTNAGKLGMQIGEETFY